MRREFPWVRIPLPPLVRGYFAKLPNGRNWLWAIKGPASSSGHRCDDRWNSPLLQVASSVGLAIQPDALGYSATKRAAVAVNEWLALKYRREGINVSVFCPQGMKTPMLFAGLEAGSVASRMSLPEARSPEDAVDAVVEGLRKEQFLILLQERPLNEYRSKAVDYDKWMDDRIDEYLGVAALIASERNEHSD